MIGGTAEDKDYKIRFKKHFKICRINSVPNLKLINYKVLLRCNMAGLLNIRTNGASYNGCWH